MEFVLVTLSHERGLTGDGDLISFVVHIKTEARTGDLPHDSSIAKFLCDNTRVGTLIVATIYLQLIQNRYMFRSFTVLQCSHQHCVQPLPAMWKS